MVGASVGGRECCRGMTAHGQWVQSQTRRVGQLLQCTRQAAHVSAPHQIGMQHAGLLFMPPIDIGSGEGGRKDDSKRGC